MTATEISGLSGSPTRARGRGRPSKRTPARAQRILEGLRLGSSYEGAAAHAGISSALLSEWRADDPEFAAECDVARVEGEMTMLERIDAAADDPRNWRAAAWSLERIFPERYALKRLEITGAGGGPVEEVCEVVRTRIVSIAQLTVDELRRLANDDTSDASSEKEQ